MTNPFYFAPTRANAANPLLAHVLLNEHPLTEEIDTFFKENAKEDERIFALTNIAENETLFTVVTKTLILQVKLRAIEQNGLLNSKTNYSIKSHGGITSMHTSEHANFAGNQYDRRTHKELESVSVRFSKADEIKISILNTVKPLEEIALALTAHMRVVSESN